MLCSTHSNSATLTDLQDHHRPTAFRATNRAAEIMAEDRDSPPELPESSGVSPCRRRPMALSPGWDGQLRYFVMIFTTPTTRGLRGTERG